MMDTQNYWKDNSANSMQVKYESLDGRNCKDQIYRTGVGAGYCEGNLNFTTTLEDDEVYAKKKVSRQDPMSHRIIEKRRRDRMNNCLADLSRLIPAEYLKKGRGRIEKTEIIEMAIRHMKHLQSLRQDTMHATVTRVHDHPEGSVDSGSHSTAASTAAGHYRLGFQECLNETINYLIEVEGYYARDSLCVQLTNHLQQHCEKILATNDRLGFPQAEMPTSTGSTSGTSYAHATIRTICQPTVQFEHGSGSGASCFEDPERSQRPPGSGVCCNAGIIPPPTIVSDDSNHSTHPSASNSCRPQNYKFKSSIKQRFSAERIKSSISPCASPEKQANLSHGVPIFALHDGGAFYVPLTVEASVLSPYFGFIPENGPDMVLHPVTISVNFNQHSTTPSAASPTTITTLTAPTTATTMPTTTNTANGAVPWSSQHSPIY